MSGFIDSHPTNSRQSWMNMADQAGDEFAHRWAAAIGSMVLTNVTRAELEAVLRGFTDELLAAVISETYDSGKVHRVGRAMIENDFISTSTLERTIQFFGENFLLRFALADTLAPRLFRMLGSLAAGYSDGLRDRTLDQQELSRTAAIITIRRAEEALRASEAKFRAVFSSSAIGIAVTSLDGAVMDFNDALLTLLGYTDEELRSLTMRELIHPDDRASLGHAEAQLATSGREHFRTEKRMVRGDGDTVETLLAMSLVRDPNGEPDYHVTMVENMDELRSLQTLLERQSLHDVQTAMANRAQFLGWLEGAAGTKGPDTVALVHFDIDGFHVINDAFGHESGNKILTSVANNLRTVFGEVGQIARIGPDEFGVLVKNPTDIRSVVVLVEQALERMAEAVFIDDDHGVGVTASVGIVVREARGGDAADLLRSAGITVGWAKADGKAQWALYDPERDVRDRERFKLTASIPGAMEQGEFRVDYEPVYSLADRKLMAVEAKLRWDHPKHGMLDPERFMRLTTNAGMAVPLGRWAMEHACEQAGQWYAEFGDAAPVLSMDLSARQCQEPELVAEVRRVLRTSGLPATMLQLELHERLPMILSEDQTAELDILAGHGVRLVFDQLGGGNIAYDRLRRIPLSGIKFTGSAVHGLDKGANHVEESAAVALLRWSSMLRLQLFADDVRTAAEVERLTELEVTGAQGPYFGEPVTAEGIHRMLAG